MPPTRSTPPVALLMLLGVRGGWSAGCRATKAGEVDLRGLREEIERTGLSDIGKAISDKKTDAFAEAYKQTLQGCYACHRASEKPYLRPRMPEQPETRIINFDPAATW